MNLLFMVLALSFSKPTPVIAQTIAPIEVSIEYSTTTAESFIRSAAAKYKVSGDDLVATLRCESHFRNIQSNILVPTGPNGHEDSWGVAQIHLKSHPEITKAQALDPLWSIDWAAREFAAGRQWQWTCWNDLFGA